MKREQELEEIKEEEQILPVNPRVKMIVKELNLDLIEMKGKKLDPIELTHKVILTTQRLYGSHLSGEDKKQLVIDTVQMIVSIFVIDPVLKDVLQTFIDLTLPSLIDTTIYFAHQSRNIFKRRGKLCVCFKSKK